MNQMGSVWQVNQINPVQAATTMNIRKLGACTALMVGSIFLFPLYANADTDCVQSPSKTMADLYDGSNVTVLAHRGLWGGYLAGNNAPENSYTAFAQADSRCMDGIEIDVKMTRDGVPVAMHDFNLGRTTSIWQGARQQKYDPYKNTGYNPSVDSISSFTLSYARLLSPDRSKITRESIPTIQKVIDGWIKFKYRSILVFDTKTASAVTAIGKIIKAEGNVTDPGKGSIYQKSDYFAMKVNATTFPSYQSFLNAVGGPGLSTAIPVFTPNMLTKIDVGSVIKNWYSGQVFEIDVKNRGGLLQNYMNQVRRDYYNVGVFNALPDANPSKGEFFKNTGQCCYTLDSLLVVSPTLKDTQDLRGDWNYLIDQGFKTITSDDSYRLTVYLRSKGLHS
ncbi:glycerophosphoryl diester phosphodiesterase [Burkholderia glumae BGR1]|nr:glycerophosphoryl diester phosphodiesterase [Burkholderia glumae BGR1]QGA40712.1 glycerophosphodiester phosphodiesterase [Burkholderia glumae]